MNTLWIPTSTTVKKRNQTKNNTNFPFFLIFFFSTRFSLFFIFSLIFYISFRPNTIFQIFIISFFPNTIFTFFYYFYLFHFSNTNFPNLIIFFSRARFSQFLLFPYFSIFPFCPNTITFPFWNIFPNLITQLSLIGHFSFFRLISQPNFISWFPHTILFIFSVFFPKFPNTTFQGREKNEEKLTEKYL